MADEPQTTTPQPFNQDALAGMMRESVRGALSEFAQQAQQQQAQQQQVRQQQAAAQVRQQDPVGQAIAPYVEPWARAAALRAESALDATLFYQTHPEAIRYRDTIERDFNEAPSRLGVPVNRETVYRHFIGSNPDQWMKDRATDVMAGAARGATLGAPGIGRPADLPVLDGATARSMTDAQLDAALDGKVF